MNSQGQRLRSEHQSLDALFEDIANRARCGETAVLDAGWSALETALTDHMAFEEERLLPQLARLDAAEAERIRSEHAQIRSTLSELGIAIELHTLREETVREFLTLLRAHAAREDRTLYACADASATTDATV